VNHAILPCQKRLFSLDENVHYLNCAYMSPLLRSVEVAGVAGIVRKRNPGALQQHDFFAESDVLRQRFAQLINAPDPQRVALIPSASYGVAIAAQNVSTRPGQHVLIAHEQFPSNVYAWQALRNKGVVVKTVMPPERTRGRAQVWNERLLEAINRDTAVVALGHVHWAHGTRFDLEAIGERAREVGAALVIDGTQSVGALPFDVQHIQPDALICAGYKWLLGPYASGVAYFGPRFDGGEPLEQNWLLRLGSEDFSRLVAYEDRYQPGALRYDAGGRSNFILVPMLIAALEQLLEWGVEGVQAYCRHLTQAFVAEVRNLGYWVEEERGRSAHLFGLRAPAGLDPVALSQVLAAQNIFVSVRGDFIRVSPHLYNDERDFEALLDVLKRASSGV